MTAVAGYPGNPHRFPNYSICSRCGEFAWLHCATDYCGQCLADVVEFSPSLYGQYRDDLREVP